MSYVDDPDFRDIRREFLDAVGRFHAHYAFSRDWRALCQELGVQVASAKYNLYTRLGGQPTILIGVDQPANRELFSGLHELSHHLFRATDEGFAALLEDKYPPEFCRELEERLCNEAAALLLFPEHEVEATLKREGLTPAAVTHLAANQGSLAAAIVRVLHVHDLDLWGLLLDRYDQVEFSWSTTRFSLGRGHLIEDGHPIHEARHGPVECKAKLPYCGGNRRVPRTMRAAPAGRRLVALFARTFPVTPDASQPTLFTPFPPS